MRATRKLGIELDARLAFAPGIFHSKLIVMQHAQRAVAFIGSANATTAAMQRNEEIMLRVQGDLTELVDYANRICAKQSVAVEDVKSSVPRSLVAFFRTGSLYYKSEASLSLTLNPFREIERKLTDGQKLELGSVTLPYAEAQTGIGPFSLVRALDLPEGDRSVKLKTKQFVVETSLGYWVPDALCGEFEKKQRNAARAKRKFWEKRRDTIASTGLAQARKDYKRYIDALREELKKNDIRPERLLDRSRLHPLALDHFDGFYLRVNRRLQNPEFFERLTQPLHRARLLEIWEDTLAREEFEDSFFGYLEYIGTLHRYPRVPGIILRELSGSPESAKEIKRALSKRLAKGWAPELWQK